MRSVFFSGKLEWVPWLLLIDSVVLKKNQVKMKAAEKAVMVEMTFRKP
jgi:hypothetical protein